MYRLATDLKCSRADIGRLSSLEITGWIAYYQVKDWMAKAEKEDPREALRFAQAVHEMTVEAEHMRRHGNHGRD